MYNDIYMNRKFALTIILVAILVISIVAVLITRPLPLIEHAKKIGAYYYIWWGIDINNHWVKDDIKGTPFLGYYNSSDSTVADQHILLAKQHKIDFFAVSWMGKGDWIDWDFDDIDQNLRSGLLEAPHLKDFNFCLFYETVLVLDNAFNEHQNFTEIFINDTLYAAKQYFTNPSYLRVNAEPVLFIYNIPYLYQKLPVQSVHQLLDYVRQQLAEKGVNLYIIGDMGGGPSPTNLNSDWLYSINAATSYLFSDPRKKWGVLEDARKYYPRWLSTMSSKGIAFVPNVYPGFNNTNNTNVSPPWAVLPRNETKFRDMLEIALDHTDSNLGIAMITSWNEWMEGTTIEPSMEEGELFLHVVYDIVPEFPQFLILPLFMVATLLAVIVHRRKHTE